MPIKCDEFNTRFKRKSSLTRHHQHFHSPTRPTLRCGQCQKIFSRRDLLKRHERLHLGEGLQPCFLCSRSFRSDYLPQHTEKCVAYGLDILQGCLSDRARETSSSIEGSLPQRQVILQWTPLLTSPMAQGRRSDERSNMPPGKRRVEQPIRILKGQRTSVISTRLRLCGFIEKAIKSDDNPALAKYLETFASMGLTMTNVDDLYKALNGTHLLNRACEIGSESVVRFFIEQKMNVNRKCSKGRPALHSACSEGKLEIVRRLIAAGAKIDASSYVGTALCHAASSGYIDIAVALLDAGANVNGTGDAREPSPLGVACATNKLHMALLLLLRGADVNAKHALFYPLTAAVKWGSLDLVTLLLQAGARVDLMDFAELDKLWEPHVYGYSQGREKLQLLYQYSKSPHRDDRGIAPSSGQDTDLNKLNNHDMEELGEANDRNGLFRWLAVGSRNIVVTD